MPLVSTCHPTDLSCVGQSDVAHYLLEAGAVCNEYTFDGDRCHYAALTKTIRCGLSQPPAEHAGAGNTEQDREQPALGYMCILPKGPERGRTGTLAKRLHKGTIRALHL